MSEEIQDKPIEMPKSIGDQFDLFFDLSDDAPFWEKFDVLTQAIVAYRMYLLRRHRTTGKKRITAEEEFLFDCMEQHKHIEKVMMSAKKLGRLPGESVNENYNTDLLARIVKMKGSVGPIVATIPVERKGGGDAV